MTSEKKIVIFGAGKIGRSFIGQVFSRSGYEVVFVDINQQLLHLLNNRKHYDVVIKSNKGDEVIQISNVRGIHLSQTEAIINELADASLAALSVGQQGMQATLPQIAQSLLMRQQKHGKWPLDFIIAENMRNADAYIKTELIKLLPGDYPIDDLVGLVETSIGKMVPIMSQKDLETDPLQVFAEAYNSLIVAKNGFKNPIPEVEFLAPKDNMKAWVDRKLFIHNLGHATAAYIGFLKYQHAVYLYEVLANREVFDQTRNTMLQSAEILMALYPNEFTKALLTDHIDDLLNRFQNKALGDTIFRIGCDLFRKLGPNDRLVAPVRAAQKLGLQYNLIKDAIMASLSFRAKDENGKFLSSDEDFFRLANNDPQNIIKKVCELESI